MAMLPPDELLKLWKLDEMPVEMTLGHVVQNLVRLREDVDRLIAHTRLPPLVKGKLKSPRPDETSSPKQSS